MKTVFLILKDGNSTTSKALTIDGLLSLDESFLDISNYLGKDSLITLIHFKQQQISYLNLTKASPYVLLFFDENLMYQGATHSINNGQGSFYIQTQYRYILFLKIPHDIRLEEVIGLSLKTKKYKYLNYLPKPVNLESYMYDLVNDTDFCNPDIRTPLLIVTQFGIFPKGNYNGKKDYGQLNGLENQSVGFIRRAYLSDREGKDIVEFLLDDETLNLIRNKDIEINFSLWNESTKIKRRLKDYNYNTQEDLRKHYSRLVYEMEIWDEEVDIIKCQNCGKQNIVYQVSTAEQVRNCIHCENLIQGNDEDYWPY